ncbi:MAG: phosphoadenosine phosphosulfate reductase family protein, partial [Flavobacteriales bacterium]
MSDRVPDYLDQLEAEAIFVLREVFAQFERPVILFSGGKDSIVVTHLARKAFYPGRVPFSLLHIDTGHNFPETIEFRDALVHRFGFDLLVGSVQQSIDTGRVNEERGSRASRNVLQTTPLLDTRR